MSARLALAALAGVLLLPVAVANAQDVPVPDAEPGDGPATAPDPSAPDSTPAPERETEAEADTESKAEPAAWPVPKDVGRLPARPNLPPLEPPPPTRRSGLLGGLSLGFGSLSAGEDSDGTLNYNWTFGGYLTNDLALVVELWGGRHYGEDDFSISNSNRGAGVLYWLSDSFWIKGAIGTADYTSAVGDTELSDFAGAAIGGHLGWVFYTPGDFHIDLRFGLTVEGYKDTRDNVTATAIQLGFTYD